MSDTNPNPGPTPGPNPGPNPGPTPDIEAIFHHARTLPAAERGAYVAAACAGHPAVRAAIEQLLAAVDNAGGFLASQGPARAEGGEGAAASSASASASAAPTAGFTTATGRITERPGVVIGPYKLLQLIGEGGFGTVFLAEQTAPVRRRVALKIIKLGMDTRQVVARFEAERQALAMMDHPHIARVLDGGATESGRPYFVMEYVVGDAITTFADAHALNIAQRLDLFGQVCSAVQHAHTKGIIHRDLKPGNVLVSMVDDKPFAKVIDFGIAKATGGGGAGHLTDKTLFTEHRQLIGTPEYMSPEQAEGSQDIDTRTDVYALGVLLYELLTGSTPIESARLRSAAYGEMQRIIREEEPLAPSMKLSRSLEKLAGTAAARRAEPGKLSALVRGELDWIVLKALEKERARRYETASALAEDVKRHLAGEPVVAAPVSRAYRVRKFVRRNRGAVGAVSAVMVALAAGGSVAAWQWSVADSRLDAFASSIAFMTGQLNGYEPTDVDRARWRETLRQTGAAPEEVLNTVGFQAIDTFKQQANQRADAAEWSAYAATLAAASIPLADNQGGWAAALLDSTPERLRGFEWSLARSRADRSVIQLRGHTADIDLAVFSPDGRWTVTGSRDKTARVWDLHSGKCVFVLQGHEAAIVAAQVTRDRSRIFTASDDGDIREWDGQTGRQLRRITTGHKWPFRDLRLSPDERLLLTNSDTRAAVVDLVSGTITWHLDENEPNALSPVSFSAMDGSLLVHRRDRPLMRVDSRTGSERATSASDSVEIQSDSPRWGLAWHPSGELRLLEPSTGRVAGVLRLPEKPAGTVSVSTRGDMLAMGVRGGDVDVLSFLTGRRVVTIPGGQLSAAQISFVAGDSRLLTVHAGADERGRASIWSLPAGHLVSPLRGADAEVWSCALSPDRRWAVTASNDGVARVWDLAMPFDNGSVGEHTRPNIDAALSADGRYIASICYYKSLDLIDTRRGNVVAELGSRSGLSDDPSSAAFLGETMALVVGTWGGQLAWYDAELRHLLSVSEGPGASIGTLITNQDGSRLVAEDFRGVRLAADSPGTYVTRTASPAAFAAHSQVGVAIGSQRLTLWDTARRALIAEVGYRDSEPVDPRQLNVLRVFDPVSGGVIRELHGLTAPLIACGISADGKMAAASDGEGNVAAWHVATGVLAWKQRFDDPVWDLRITSDGSHVFGLSKGVVSIRFDGSSYLTQSLSLTVSPPVRLELSPDGRRLLVGGGTGMLAIHDVATGNSLVRLQAHSSRLQAMKYSKDGKSLLTFPSDGSARVWDIRDPEERRKDLQAEWAERVPAGAYLDTLWASDTPDDKFQDAVINDASLTPLRRLVAAEILEERLEDDRIAAERAFEQMKQAAVPADVATGSTPAADPASITNAVRAAAAAAELPKRVKARVVALAAGWEYKRPEPTAEQKLAEQNRQRRLAEAMNAVLEHEGLDLAIPTKDQVRRTQEALATFEEILGPRSLEACRARVQVMSGREGVTQEALLRARAELGLRNGDLFETFQNLWLIASSSGSGNSLTHPTDYAIQAMARWRAVHPNSEDRIEHVSRWDVNPDGFTSGRVLTADEHRQLAREALAKARDLLAPAADGTPSPWANDQDAKALLAEAAALIEGAGAAQPATPAKEDK